MDSMQKELEMWKEENKEHQIALKREQRFELRHNKYYLSHTVFVSETTH
jgi:hypothetical protein